MIKHIGRMAVLLVITTVASWADAPLNDNELTAERSIHPGFGYGVIVGASNGLSTNGWLTYSTNINAPAARSSAESNAFQIHIDQLLNNYDLIKTKELPGQISGYFGFGGSIHLKGSTDAKSNRNKTQEARMGLRVPVGLSYTLKENPVELFAELVPLLHVVPETKIGIGVGVGARYCFALR